MTLGKSKKQITVIIETTELERLKILADKEERSVSQTAAILIREGLERRELSKSE